MKTIFKYPVIDSAEIKIPYGAEFLHLGVQGSDVFMWLYVDTTADLVKRKFTVVGTGWDCDHLGNIGYVGTCQQGAFVWHVFEMFGE